MQSVNRSRRVVGRVGSDLRVDDGGLRRLAVDVFGLSITRLRDLRVHNLRLRVAGLHIAVRCRRAAVTV